MSQRARSEAKSGVRGNSGLAPTRPQSSTSVERIGALTPGELAEVAPSHRGLQSGAFAKRPDGSTALDWQTFKQPPPPPAAGRPAPLAPSVAERAELHIADLGLQLANPFIGSSLQPPPPKTRPWLKPLLITAAGAALLCAGYAGAMYQRTTDPTTARSESKLAPEGRTSVIDHDATDLARPAAAGTAALATPARHRLPVNSVVQPTVGAAAASIATPVTAKPGAGKADATPRRRARPRARTRAAQKTSATAAADATITGEAQALEQTAPATSAAATAPKGAQQLTRAQVQTGLEAMRSALKTCAAGNHGQMMASVTISGAGRVTYATVEGAFAGTPQGSCMARALRGAQFPSFTSEQLRVRYPFVF